MDGRIKVAQVITRMDWGGSPDIVRTICTHLDPVLYDVTLIIGATQHPSARTDEFFKKFEGKVITLPSLKRNINPFMDLRALAQLFLIFRDRRFDIVHTHTSKAGALGRIAAYMARVPGIIHTPHGHLFYGYYGRITSSLIIMTEKFLTRFTKIIIALTELEKNDMVHFRVAPKKKIKVVYQGLEFEEYSARGKIESVKRSLRIQNEELVVGMVGRLEPVKGAKYFVEMAKIVAGKFPDVKFMMVGEGSMRKAIERAIKKFSLDDRFILTGWRENMPEMFSVLDILVLPSLNEAVGIVLIEAQARGIPVVASDVGGIPEIVKDGYTGLLIPPADPVALAGAVGRLLANSAERKKMGDAGRLWVEGRFRADDMAARISDIYRESI